MFSIVETDRILSYYAFMFTLIMPFALGYSVFMPDNWDTATFFFSYTIIGVLPFLFVIWKVLHRTRVRLFDVVIC